jgi:hypothetical protein
VTVSARSKTGSKPGCAKPHSKSKGARSASDAVAPPAIRLERAPVAPAETAARRPSARARSSAPPSGESAPSVPPISSERTDVEPISSESLANPPIPSGPTSSAPILKDAIASDRIVVERTPTHTIASDPISDAVRSGIRDRRDVARPSEPRPRAILEKLRRLLPGREQKADGSAGRIDRVRGAMKRAVERALGTRKPFFRG